MLFDSLIFKILKENKLKSKISIKDLAKKHKVSKDEIKKRLRVGINVEKEHTKDLAMAETIASHHIYEVLDYYKKLKKVE